MFVIWSAKVSNSFPPTLLYGKNLRKIIIIGFLNRKIGCRVAINMAVWKTKKRIFLIGLAVSASSGKSVFLFINIVRLINVGWLKTVPRLKTRRG